MIDKTQKALMHLKSDDNWSKPSNKWPEHWKDLLHDEDGGCDMFGRRTQDGRATLKHELIGPKMTLVVSSLIPNLSSRHGRWR